jgi:tryptophan synthase alpha chain
LQLLLPRWEANITGNQRITQAFNAAKLKASAALMPYYTLGYPDYKTSLDVIEAIAPHSDLMELGIPFSDPIADGPTIQRSTQIALKNGATTTQCLEMVKELRRQRGITTPILLMGYYNPIIAYGEDNFVRDAAYAGVDGLIIPDLPIEEAGLLAEETRKSGLSLVYFLAPTSHHQRIGRVISQANGFIYIVSVLGVTGARSRVAGDTRAFVESVKSKSEIPVAVGFGISTPDQAAEIANYADGIIFGSALIDIVEQADNKPKAAAAFVRSMGQGLQSVYGNNRDD